MRVSEVAVFSVALLVAVLGNVEDNRIAKSDGYREVLNSFIVQVLWKTSPWLRDSALPAVGWFTQPWVRTLHCIILLYRVNHTVRYKHSIQGQCNIHTGPESSVCI